ncbi:centrosomal and chromosomal factor-like isoform X2 [Daphnia pulex]|uniref:centrosomal and chromosomal factor-like isoform X2 n=1 Tax=Daphnia pulex TaxID=6669 RepID=UPI001EE027A9|nr:centrosomal and chromosomal factor-like isoform X2 [Daphnia pulex]
MSAICCAVPSLNLMATGGGVAGSSSLPVVYPHHHFSRPSAPLHHPNSFSFMELNNSSSHQYQQLPCHQPVDQFTATVYGSSQQQQQHHQQFIMPQQQAVASCSQRASRRKKLEDALTEAIPAASSGKVSQRIAQLQQSLYASCHPGRMIQQQQQYPSVSSSSSSRPLSLDPLKDYSQPLTVDCSIEYDLPRVTRPPPGAKPLLLIARRPPPPPTLPAVVSQSPPTRQRQQQQQQQEQWNPAVRTAHHHHQVLLQQQQQQQSSQQQFQFRPDCGYFVMNIAPVSSSSSEDSGRGTDSEQHPSASSPITSYRTAVHPANNNWTSIAEPQWSLIRQQQQLKFNQQHVKPTALPQHPRPAEAARARVSMTTEQSSGCHCCPSRSNQFPVQRWAPYTTTQTSMMAARHGCPAPSSVVFQQQQQQESWTRWNDSSVSLDQLILQQTPHYNNNNNHPSSSSSLMAFHI